jgi:hypothetical protein
MSEELKNLVMIRTLLRSANFEIKGEAVPVMASSLVWLDKKIAEIQTAQAIAKGEVREIAPTQDKQSKPKK